MVSTSESCHIMVYVELGSQPPRTIDIFCRMPVHTVLIVSSLLALNVLLTSFMLTVGQLIFLDGPDIDDLFDQLIV